MLKRIVTIRHFARRVAKHKAPLQETPVSAANVEDSINKVSTEAVADQDKDLDYLINKGVFEGLPIKRTEPETQEDFNMKLYSTKFSSLDQVLQFYTKNRATFKELH